MTIKTTRDGARPPRSRRPASTSRPPATAWTRRRHDLASQRRARVARARQRAPRQRARRGRRRAQAGGAEQGARRADRGPAQPRRGSAGHLALGARGARGRRAAGRRRRRRRAGRPERVDRVRRTRRARPGATRSRRRRADRARARKALPSARRQVVLADAAPADPAHPERHDAPAAGHPGRRPGGARHRSATSRGWPARSASRCPADEVLFFTTLPLRVDSVRVRRGDTVSGRVMTVSNSRLAIDSSLSITDAKLVRPGATVKIEEPDLGIKTTGVVTQVADRPGTHKVDPGRVYLSITPRTRAGAARGRVGEADDRGQEHRARPCWPSPSPRCRSAPTEARACRCSARRAHRVRHGRARASRPRASSRSARCSGDAEPGDLVIVGQAGTARPAPARRPASSAGGTAPTGLERDPGSTGQRAADLGCDRVLGATSGASGPRAARRAREPPRIAARSGVRHRLRTERTMTEPAPEPGTLSHRPSPRLTRGRRPNGSHAGGRAARRRAARTAPSRPSRRCAASTSRLQRRLAGDRRAVGLRQVHAAEHPRLPRPPDGRHLPGRRDRRGEPQRRAARVAARAQHRLRLPDLPPARPPHRARERDARRRVRGRRPRRAGEARARPRSSGSAWATAATSCPPSSRAASSSAWRSPGRCSGSPSLLLCDEPTGNLDSVNTESVLALFHELGDDGLTLVVITHDEDVAEHARRERAHGGRAPDRGDRVIRRLAQRLERLRKLSPARPTGSRVGQLPEPQDGAARPGLGGRRRPDGASGARRR